MDGLDISPGGVRRYRAPAMLIKKVSYASMVSYVNISVNNPCADFIRDWLSGGKWIRGLMRHAVCSRHTWKSQRFLYLFMSELTRVLMFARDTHWSLKNIYVYIYCNISSKWIRVLMFAWDTLGSLKDSCHFITLFAWREKMNRIMKNTCICFGTLKSRLRHNIAKNPN